MASLFLCNFAKGKWVYFILKIYEFMNLIATIKKKKIYYHCDSCCDHYNYHD